MLYTQQLVEASTGRYHSMCRHTVAKSYDSWLVPSRVLKITPAQLILKLQNEYSATVKYFPIMGIVSYFWDDKKDAQEWNDFINEKSKEANFRV